MSLTRSKRLPFPTGCSKDGSAGSRPQAPARSLLRFLRNVNTEPRLRSRSLDDGAVARARDEPLMEDSGRYSGRVVFFNAWHREEEHLLAALFEAIRNRAAPGWWSWPGFVFRSRLVSTRSKSRCNAFTSVCTGELRSGTICLALPNLRIAPAEDIIKSAQALFGEDVSQTWQAIYGVALAGSGNMMLLLATLGLRASLSRTGQSGKLVAALARRASLGDFSDKLSFRHRFGEQFNEVCNALLTLYSRLGHPERRPHRCQPEDTSGSRGGEYPDRRGRAHGNGYGSQKIRNGVGHGFEKLVEGKPDDESLYASEETPDKAGKQALSPATISKRSSRSRFRCRSLMTRYEFPLFREGKRKKSVSARSQRGW